MHNKKSCWKIGKDYEYLIIIKNQDKFNNYNYQRKINFIILYNIIKKNIYLNSFENLKIKITLLIERLLKELK